MKKNKINKIRVLAIILLLMIVLIYSLSIICIVPNIIPKNEEKIDIIETVAEAIEENTITTDSIIEDLQKEELLETLIPMYTTTGVNIRISPSLESSIYKTVIINTIVNKVENGEEGDWSKIKIDENYYYIYSTYLSADKTIIQTTSRSEMNNRAAAAQGDFVGYFTLTYYCPCSKCCGKTTGITAWGTKATAGRTIAASSNYAFGTKLNINGHTYTVEDRGGAIKGNKIDIFVSSHSEALALGRQTNVPVYAGE